MRLIPFKEARRLFVRAYLREALKSAPTVTEVTRAVGMNRTDFYKVCQRYGVHPSKRNPKTHGVSPYWLDWVRKACNGELRD